MLVGYFLIVVLLLIFGVLNAIKENDFTTIAFIALSYCCILFLAIFRTPTFVTDDLNYLPVFLGQSSCYFESGFCFVLQCIQHFGTSLPIYFGILAGLVFTPIWIFVYKYSCNVTLSILAFFCLMYAFNAVNVVRQFLALGIVLLSFPFIIEKRFFIFFCFIMFASMFHSSVFVCISFYWLYRTKASLKNILFLFVISILVFLSFNYVSSLYLKLGGEYAHYVTGAVETTRLSNVIRFILNLMITVLALLILRFTSVSQLRSSKLNIDFLVLCSCIATSAAFIALQAYRAERIAYYFYLFNIVTLPQIIHSIKNRSIRYMTCLILLLCMISYGAVVLWSWQQRGMVYSFLWS